MPQEDTKQDAVAQSLLTIHNNSVLAAAAVMGYLVSPLPIAEETYSMWRQALDDVVQKADETTKEYLEDNGFMTIYAGIQEIERILAEAKKNSD